MNNYERQRAFVRDYLSPLVAAAKNTVYSSWECVWLTGAEVMQTYHPWREKFWDTDEIVVATVTDANGEVYRYYINVWGDSFGAMTYDVMKVLMYK